MKYGTIFTKESYHNDTLKQKTVWNEESLAISDKSHLIDEILIGVDMAMNNDSKEVTLTIHRNADGKLRLVKKWKV